MSELTVKIKYHGDTEPLERIAVGDWIDLRAAETVTLKAGEWRPISLGISMELPQGYEAHILPRSSTFKRWGVILPNAMGIIDQSYCGDNDIWHFSALALRDTTISKGDRICQFRIMAKMPPVTFLPVETLGNDDRGGFGSTGDR